MAAFGEDPGVIDVAVLWAMSVLPAGARIHSARRDLPPNGLAVRAG